MTQAVVDAMTLWVGIAFVLGYAVGIVMKMILGKS